MPLSFAVLILSLVSSLAFADINGTPESTGVKCDASVFSAGGFICDLFEKFAGASVCHVTANTCTTDGQELFTGANIELASPSNIKKWTGFGGSGAGYQAAQLCLLRDLKDGPLSTEATAATALGNLSVKQTIQFGSYNRDTFEWTGWQRAQACAPVVGCLDIITQKIRAQAVITPLPAGSGKYAGEYAIQSLHGMQMEADGLSQEIKTTIPAIRIDTPYGVIQALPEFAMGRAIGIAQAPWSMGNAKSSLPGPWSTAKMYDLYGRYPGMTMTQTYPYFASFSNGTIDNRVIGYYSQVGLGARDANMKSDIWTPPAGVEFPPRPDNNLQISRSTPEKGPNGHLNANVKVEYSPTELLPESIRKNPYITIAFKVWAKPLVETAFTTQFDVQHFEIADGRTLLSPGGPIDYRPTAMDEWKGVNIAAASSAAARVALEAGVDLNLHLKVPLLWPLKPIDLDLVDLHPIVTPLESIVSGYSPGSQTAYAFTEAKASAASGEWFQQYHKFSGAVPSGKAEVTACLKAPSTSQPPPPAPTYTPGNPQDLTKIIQYPCNICIGMHEYKWTDNDGKEHVISEFLETLFAADESSMPAAAQWNCDLIAESGCHDICNYNPATKKLTVAQTAIQLIAAGKADGMPLRCH